MALQVGKLKQFLLDIQQNYPANYEEAGRRWASAYATYAADAISPLGGSPLALAAAERVLGVVLGSVFAISNTPPQTASAYASGLTTFWLSPPVAFTGTPPGLVTAVVGTALLQSTLLSAWAANMASRAPADVSLGRIASAFDAFTRTVVVTHPVIPTPVIGPIS